MSKSKFSDDFKRDAVRQITVRGYMTDKGSHWHPTSVSRLIKESDRYRITNRNRLIFKDYIQEKWCPTGDIDGHWCEVVQMA